MSRKNGRPTFRLSFNSSGMGGFDPSCRPTCIMVDDEPRALSMAEIETKRQAGEALSMDDMLAIAEFNSDPLNAALGGSAFSDDYLSIEAPDLGGPEMVGKPEKPVLEEPEAEETEETEPPVIDVWEHVDQAELDAVALRIFADMQKRMDKIKPNRAGKKPELGAVINADSWNEETQQFEGLRAKKIQQGDADSVDYALSPSVSVAMMHIHPPEGRGSRTSTDSENRRLSKRDTKIMEAFFEGGKAFRKQAKPFPKINRKIVSYLITPRGELRRMTYDERNSFGEVVGTPERFKYYK